MTKIRSLNPGLGKVEQSRGAKVGAVSGIISGAVFSTLSLFGSWVMGWLRPRQSNELVEYVSFETYVANTFLSPYFVTAIISSIIFGAIEGLLFRSLFIVLYDKLPGKTPTIKGIVKAISQWVVAYFGYPLLFYLIMGSITGWRFDGMVSYFTNIHYGRPIITIGLVSRYSGDGCWEVSGPLNGLRSVR